MSILNVLARLTPNMSEVLAKQSELADNAFATDVGFEEMRENYAKERLFWNEGGPVMAETVDGIVPFSAGGIKIRTHRPSTKDNLPCIMFIHGGGFVVGNLDTHDRIMRALAEATGSVVVGIDYSLSPEAKFPQSIHECAAVACYLRENAKSFGIDGERLSFAGDSGGANLSFATTLYLRDEASNGPRIETMLLYYGMYGLRDSRSQRLYGGEWDGLTPADLEYYMTCYLKDLSEMESTYINVLGADLSHGIPPCYIAAPSLDPLLDDSTTLAETLTELGVPNRSRVFEGVLHGFLHHSRMLPEAVNAIADGAEFYRSVTEAPTV